MITNDCHVFIEIQDGSGWKYLDLGGYPSQFNVQPVAKPPLSRPTTTISIPTSAALSVVPDPAHVQKQVVVAQNVFYLWNKQKVSFTDMAAYGMAVLQCDVAKRLIKCNSHQELLHLQVSLKKQCMERNIPWFYVHTAEDLNCKTMIMQPGSLPKVDFGGLLYQFLMQSGHGVLLINYENFTPNDIVANNGLLDTVRVIDGVTLAQSIKIIAIVNTHSVNYYQEEDFYSRFDRIEICPTFKHEQPVDMVSVAHTSPVNIDLYERTDWQNYLLGQWHLQDQSLVYKSGLLEKIDNKSICFFNAPEDPAFYDLLYEINYLQRVVHANKVIIFDERLYIHTGKLQLCQGCRQCAIVCQKYRQYIY